MGFRSYLKIHEKELESTISLSSFSNKIIQPHLQNLKTQKQHPKNSMAQKSPSNPYKMMGFVYKSWICSHFPTFSYIFPTFSYLLKDNDRFNWPRHPLHGLGQAGAQGGPWAAAGPLGGLGKQLLQLLRAPQIEQRSVVPRKICKNWNWTVVWPKHIR